MITMRPRNAGLKILFSSGLRPSPVLPDRAWSPDRRSSFTIVSVPALVVRMMMRVLEIDLAAFAVFHLALVEHLEEEFQNVGMRLLDFVQQHHRIRAGDAPLR